MFKILPDPISSSAIPDCARAVLEIDLDAIRANWLALRAAGQPSSEAAAVVKANAYGLGLEPVARTLSDAGATTFFVATIAEGRRLRAELADATIYVLDGLLPGTADAYRPEALRPVLSSREQIEEWAAACQRWQVNQPAAVQIDTGMTRLGLDPVDVVWFADSTGDLGPFRPALILSHLACADAPGTAMTSTQAAAFQSAREKLAKTPASLANSAAILATPEARLDLMRPGIALYGGRALDGAPNPMRQVVRYMARILQVREVPPGTAIGYGATFRTTRKLTWIATVATGYADGYPRAAVDSESGIGPMGYVGETAVPIVGRISMDLITVDVTDAQPDLLHRDSWVTLFDDRTTIDDIADAAGTIGYEILTRLGDRAHRVYHSRQPAPHSAEAN